MEIYNNFDTNNNNKRTITIGDFDGLHMGHQELIKKTIDVAKKSNTISSALTFKFNTANIISNNVKYLCSIDEKIELMKKTGVDELLIVEFNEDIKKQKAEDFIKNTLIKKLNVQNIVLGDDAKLGSDRLAMASIQKICDKLMINLHKLPQIGIGDKRVTSSYIRSLITDGIVDERLKQFLGRDYSFVGEVVHGNSFGKILGFPTANIIIDSTLVVPKYGVYYATCEIDGKLYNSGINIGDKPSVENNYFGLEAFLIDFDDDIYGKKIKINLKKFVRKEEKFDTIEELRCTITRDIEYIKNHLI